MDKPIERNQQGRNASGPSLLSGKQGSNSSVSIPSVALPKGGGAVRGIDEKFLVNAVTGTSSFSIPVPLSASRNGFAPALSLTYNSGAGNTAFGLGWQMDTPAISRRTDKKLPLYQDEEESDTFIAGGEDLVPFLQQQPDQSWKTVIQTITENGVAFTVKQYRPRTEGAFALIEKWRNNATGETFWRTVSGDNLRSYYGDNSESRISDPDNPLRVFSWLLTRTHDDKGNIYIYYYKKEDHQGIPAALHEKNKAQHTTQAYLKKVVYGNKKAYYLGDDIPGEEDFMFKVILDYGEHDAAMPFVKTIDQEKNTWACRKDPFSSYRQGFEVRTYRRCERILLFHCFSELPLTPYLVNSLQLLYNDQLPLPNNSQNIPGYSFLVKARHNGHLWKDDTQSYSTKSLPDIVIQYQQHEWNTTIESLLPGDAEQLPIVLHDKSHIWIDLFNEGVTGILTEQSNEWYYQHNLGNGHFSKPGTVNPRPATSGGLATGRLAVIDLEGNGIKYLARLDEEPKGFFKLTAEDAWQSMQLFESNPTVSLANPHARLVDLDGDGRADLLVTEQDSMRWYPSAGEKGFELPCTISKAIDEEKGPAIVFADTEQQIFLADMSGDGLSDIVRIRNGEICYWPNIGYGKFGAKVTMDNAPVFDHHGAFNASYIRLADIDGSGTIDVIYLGKNDFRVWMNGNGNRWSDAPLILDAFPGIDNVADIDVIDLLGQGTACIVYTSPLTHQPVQYINLMGGRKPHLLSGYKNNCGLEVTIAYQPSTYYYLKDKKEGNAWITRLPFPVHCIASVKTEDKIRETVFTSSYAYRHGYYDYEEGEFRGFARVEQLDTEVFEQFAVNNAKNVVEKPLHQPPVKTITWYHTGAYMRNRKILHQCESEYFANNDFAEYVFPDPMLPAGLSGTELQEAYRCCKGIALRTEVYGEDASDKSAIPYTVTQSSFEIRLVQPKENNSHASFLLISDGAITYNYDRNATDPRISQVMILAADVWGNVTSSAAITYPRKQRPTGSAAIPDKVWDSQNKLAIVYDEALFTKDKIDAAANVYRLRIIYDTQSYELGGLSLPAGFFFQKADILTAINNAQPLSFEEDWDGSLQKKLTAHSRGYFYKDDLSGPLAAGELPALAIPYKSYQMAFTQKMVSKYYGSKVTDQMLEDAQYVHIEGDAHWWLQPGEAIYPANPKAAFYKPTGMRDVYGNESHVQYDTYTFLTTASTDAIGNTTTAVNDYRLLAPVLITDANLNRGAIATDELGMVTATALMGKDGAGEGDTLADPTIKVEYDVLNWQNNQQPNYTHSLAREWHGAANARWQESYAYTDGGGGTIMTKVKVAPGKARIWNNATKQVEEVAAATRWVGNGRTIFNNKGNPVKQYEPYFSTTHHYESEAALVETGFSSITYYDAAGRNYKKEYPNGTFSTTVYDPWHSRAYDVNDTILESEWYAKRGSPDPLAAEPTDAETRAAWLVARHANTPAVTYLDILGRTTYVVEDCGNGKTIASSAESDTTQHYGKLYDQLGRLVSEGRANMIGVNIYGKSAEKGERWSFTDVAGRLVKVWDNNEREIYSTFDALNRPVSSFIKEGGVEKMVGYMVYGDMLPDAAAIAANRKGRAYQLYDQSGVVTFASIDFKGNNTRVERRLAKDYQQTQVWDVLAGLDNITDIETAAAAKLEAEVFAGSSVLDAFNRPQEVTLPDNSIVKVAFNEGGYPDSIQVKIRGAGGFITFLDKQEYNEKGQRLMARYGNGTTSSYLYDPYTQRLLQTLTKQHDADAAGAALQNLLYTFDPVGNLVQIRDDAQQTHFFKNSVVYPENKFEYDALYQLTKATGREHVNGGLAPYADSDLSNIAQLPHVNDANAVVTYTEKYEYDDCGNIKKLQHSVKNADSSSNTWSRRYKYAYEEDASNATNRLLATSLAGDADGVFSGIYTHNLWGNITAMPHLSAADSLQWNAMDQLQHVNLGGGGNAWYVYGVGGNRVRKVIERIGGKILERINLGSVEIYRERQGSSAPVLERYTLHIADNTGKIAQVDTKTIDTLGSDTVNLLNENNIRYQYGNHIGSATLETDNDGNILSYEEYYPYGTSAYRISKTGSDISLKRYRFCGKEKDEETGFYYYGARYYAAWLARWTSSDPAGFVDGFNLYRYCINNPVNYQDPNGTDVLFRNDKLNSKASFADLSKYAPEGLRVMDHVTAGNYSKYWNPKTNTWDVYESIPPPVAPDPPDAGSHPDASATDGGSSAGGAPSTPPANAEPAAPVADDNDRSGGSVTGAATTNDSYQRKRYETTDRAASRGAQEGIAEARARGDSAGAMKTAEEVSTLRNTRRTNTQGLLTPHGRAISQAIEKPSDFPLMRDRYTNRVPSVEKNASNIGALGHTDDEFEIARRIAVAAGESRPSMRYLAKAGRVLGPIGAVLSVLALGNDLYHKDWSMAAGDSLTVAGGAMELYALYASAGAAAASGTTSAAAVTIAGVAALPLGLVVGGVGMAITSGISMKRAMDRGDTAGAVVGGVGIAAGASIAVGGAIALAGAAVTGTAIAAAAPVLIIGGAVAALGVGAYHLGKYFNWW
ncbi:RHS repeat-associated core domain-containing protein [Filimonas lacunae]|uniref:RHS repeat-associated core domain-containing protein n=1 Tax=Filimonas lacunae TaxID=477680 RepID=A0A173MHD6_9BACT|nr:SpvB/TcaC N-terminal domain-containing protein [Filimonas lacunae]BAV06841.1 insecticidal toxin complex protein [Filimonas lacunae]SIS99003.1 RHS repeat-associated core domain-containing protein [Filimonas lacunae]